ncbi:SusD/RagB family nutrient-binding outer membrane lipoprotein [Aureibaculum marinum]|uniref:SusD/RagB family nutrient-binding outer membrane lipoprotein n=1 Tax=Aureibaculum marinum TaxID=2487930 RepID=A0A3N4NKK7_9FLAO|nr:SusD/RagB family nutrient-binding outer membrane lipoprotein [Aureibaculum marinum]RPD96741.1 SusD/RagB family nutrient-binding outer membrane lipoprotein [Aureibaculum marinum]
MKKKFIYILSIFFSLVSCEDYLDVNNNIDGPAYADGYLYLANITQQYQGIYWDIRAIAPMAQMWGTTSYTAFANNYYYLGSDSGGEIWRMTYWNQGQNLENLINQSLEAEDWTLAGIGYAMKAFSWDLLTKVHGELPMEDAFVPGLLSHDYDYQKDIYAQVREWAYTAVELLEREDNTVYADKISSNDFIYGGDKDKWKKFAYAVIVRNLSSLSNKSDFTSAYAQELIDAAEKSFQSPDDDATVKIEGGSQSAPFSGYNNFWGTARGNLLDNYFQHEYAVQVFTGTVPKYDESTGDKTNLEFANENYPFVLADKQIITDTLVNEPGHFDPRAAVKLSTISNPNYENINNPDSVKTYTYFGGSFTSSYGSIGQAPSVYGRHANSAYEGSEHDGIGRWLYRDNAPYILTTYAEIQFCLAEAYWKTNQTGLAYEAFKRGVSADMQTTARYIYPGTEGSPTGGDKITVELFNNLASEYLSGPYVEGLTDFTLSHIMMQKWVALYPWGAPEAWVDMRKYHFDVDYTGDYPSEGNGWSQAVVEQKWDTDPDKVYKGLYLAPAQVQGRKGSYSVDNQGSPSYRIRPRYNSEYMWNLPSLEKLKPIPGTAVNYHTSIPWFAYPGELPQ